MLQTALELLNNNIDVFVLADGVGSQNMNEVSVALNYMRDAGAVVTTSESIIFQLMGDAKHEKFKDISKLIKDFKEETKIALEDMAVVKYII